MLSSPISRLSSAPSRSATGVALIQGGLTPDDQVVLDGQYKLRAGARVQVFPSDKQQRRADGGTPAGITP